MATVWMGTNMASPYKALYIWVKHFSEQHENEKPQIPNSWQHCLYTNHIPDYFTLFIEWLGFLVLINQQNQQYIHALASEGERKKVFS